MTTDKYEIHCSTCQVSYLKGCSSPKDVFNAEKCLRTQCGRKTCRVGNYAPFQYLYPIK